MNNQRLWTLLIIFAMAVTVAGCDRASEGDQQSQASEEASADEDSQEASSASAGDEAEQMGLPVLPEQLTVVEFVDHARQAICYAYDNCGNERVRETAALRVLFPVSVGVEMGMGRVDDALKQEYQSLGQEMEDETTKIFGDAVCPKAVDVGMKFFGVDAATLESRIEEGAVEFDPEAAVACVEHLRQLPPICDEQDDLEQPLAFGDIQLPAAEGGDAIEEYTEGCYEMLRGTGEEGDDCLYNYECSGDLSCIIGPIGDGTVGECTAPGGDDLRTP